MHNKLFKTINGKRCYIINVFLIIILLLGFFLRYHDYKTVPRHGATFDEFAWTWLGVNLIQKGIPISWSPQPQYLQRKEIRYQGAAFLIVRPYLEHPPFFGLVAGGFALLNGVSNMYDVTLAKIRPLALFLGVLSIFIVFLLTKELYGPKVALLSALLYSTVPTIVIGSRLVQNENFLIPLWLLSIYLIARYLKTNKKYLRNLAIIIAGLLSLSKVPWLVVGLSLCMILSYKGKRRDALITGLGVAAIFSLFIFYGLYFDKELFINLWRLQVARYDISYSGFFSIFTKPLLVDRYYLDGWIIFGWFCIFLLSKDLKKHFFILIPFIAYLIMYFFAIPDEPAHGWYRYPFYPFLLISISLIIKEELSKNSLISLFFIFIVGLSLLANTFEQVFGFSFFIYRLFIIIASLTVLISQWFSRFKLYSRKLIIFWLILFNILNIISVFYYMG